MDDCRFEMNVRGLNRNDLIGALMGTNEAFQIGRGGFIEENKDNGIETQIKGICAWSMVDAFVKDSEWINKLRKEKSLYRDGGKENLNIVEACDRLGVSFEASSKTPYFTEYFKCEDGTFIYDQEDIKEDIEIER